VVADSLVGRINRCFIDDPIIEFWLVSQSCVRSGIISLRHNQHWIVDSAVDIFPNIGVAVNICAVDHCISLLLIGPPRVDIDEGVQFVAVHWLGRKGLTCFSRLKSRVLLEFTRIEIGWVTWRQIELIQLLCDLHFAIECGCSPRCGQVIEAHASAAKLVGDEVGIVISATLLIVVACPIPRACVRL
jgi:hypothetical protein